MNKILSVNVEVFDGSGIRRLEIMTDATDAESDNDYCDFLSNGFKVARGGDASNWNASGSTYVFLAMAHNPFKYATAR